ncbi:MAG: hypothetical protein KAI47_10205, partial [Deltaproteobacteria bacterium]|nr:hypothetical protein [Deltaproteobacteria bacterium]
VACRARKPKEVVVLVVTKDLWSLRLNTVYSQVGLLVDTLDFMPTEENFLGRNKRLSVHLRLSHLNLSDFRLYDQLSLGQPYLDHRLFGTRLRLYELVDVYIDGHVPAGGFVGDPANTAALRAGHAWTTGREAGAVSGFFARLRIDRPLVPLSTSWGFAADAYMRIRQVRRFNQLGDGGVALATVQAPGRYACPSGAASACRYNVPRVHDERVAVGTFEVTRAVGEAIKHDFTWGMLVYDLRHEVPRGFPFSPSIRRWYARAWLPRSEAVSAFFLRYGTRPTRFVRLRNVNTLALSENMALGPSSKIELRLAQNLRSATEPFVEMVVWASYTWDLADDLVTAAVSGTWRYQLGMEGEGVGPWVNKMLRGTLRNVTPPFLIGRLHARATLTLRDDDLDRHVEVF